MAERSIEMIHVVYADAVGYSMLEFESKSEFDDLVRIAIDEATSSREVIARIDNGDGFALGFRGDPSMAISSAIDVQNLFLNRSRIKVRIGVHCGPAYLRDDLSGSPSLTGQAIEFAQRVMTLCGGGEVVCSKAFSLALSAFPNWRNQIGFARQGRTKSGEVIAVYPVYSGSTRRIAVLHDPAVPAQEALSRRIQALSKEIEIGTLNAEFIIESLSALREGLDQCEKIIVFELSETPWSAAIRSLLAETKVHQTMVVLGKTGSAELATGDGLVHLEENCNDETLLALLLSGLDSDSHLWPQNGPIPLDSPFYVRRPADDEIELAITHRESVILLRGPRRYGKSSLILRAIKTAKSHRIKPILIDFSAADHEVFQSPENFYRWVIAKIYSEANLELLAPAWEEWVGPNRNLENAVKLFLAQHQQGCLLVFDQVDKLFRYSQRDDFFGLLRSWHNRRAISLDSNWNHLSILLSYSAEVQSLVTDVHQSPFNIGRKIELSAFSGDELRRLCFVANREFSENLEFYSGGQPELSQLLVNTGCSDESLEDAFSKLRPSAHISWIATHLLRRPELLVACRDIIDQGRTTETALTWVLLGLGIVKVSAKGGVEISNPLYRQLILALMAETNSLDR